MVRSRVCLYKRGAGSEEETGRMTIILAFIECSLICAATCLTIRFGTAPRVVSLGQLAGVLEGSLAISVSCVVAFYYQDLYDLRAVRSFRAYLRRLPLSAGLAFLLTLALWRVTRTPAIPRPSALLILAALLALLVPLRALLYGIAALRPLSRSNVVLGTGPLARQIAQELEARSGSGERLAGVVAESGDDRFLTMHAPILGTLEHLDEILSRTNPARIVVALDERRGRLPVRCLLEARVRGIAVEDGAEVLEGLTGKIAIESMAPGTLAFSSGFRACRVHDAVARATSLLLAVVGLVVFTPLGLLIAALVRLVSRGPVLFVHERVGLRGRRFGLLKFRTMHPASGATSEWVADNEDRVTRVGRWLRRYRLDELPQLVNILRGDLNLIGPRPHPASNFDLFNRIVPYYWLRARVRPGVTGWAQVRYGYANNLEEETEKMRYDLYYIMNRSFSLDARIALDTARVVLLGRGAETAETPAAGPRARDRAAVLVPHLLLRSDTGRAPAWRGAPVVVGDRLGQGARGRVA